MNIQNVDTYLYRSSQPDNSDNTLNAADWTQLASVGIQTVLDLETGADKGADGDPLREAMHGNEFKIRVYSHPLGLILPPSVDQINQALKLIKLEIAQKKAVCVQCRDGVDRTGIIIAAYRIKVQGWPVKQAIDEMYKNGFHWFYFYWVHILREI